jgi:SAM-dependent methyltransferase
LRAEFEAKAAVHWTKDREAKLTSVKNLLVRPSNAAWLLRVIGLLNGDATMSADNSRKFLQINHMLTLLKPQLEDLGRRHAPVRVFDACCGNSYLTFLIAWLFHEEWKKPCLIVGVDRNERLIARSTQRAADLGYAQFLSFAADTIDDGTWERHVSVGERPHLLVALHACDIATDFAIAAGIKGKADVIATAPCCQAELAQKWKDLGATAKAHPLAPIFRTPNLRRETAAQLTDAMRLLLLRSKGYEVTATEFVPSDHTPKNRLLLAERRGNFLAAAAEEYRALKTALGDQTIKLEELLRDDAGVAL